MMMMMMIEGGTGGANTNATGKMWEKDTSLFDVFTKFSPFKLNVIQETPKQKTFVELIYNDDIIGYLFAQNGINTALELLALPPQKERLSKKLLPDGGFISIEANAVVIVEAKYQQVNGSVDEKLQTIDFKYKQYCKMFEDSGLTVVYSYVLNDWFTKDEYEDVLKYIKELGHTYYFGQFPIWEYFHQIAEFKEE